MNWGEVNGQRIAHGQLAIRALGPWAANVTLALANLLPTGPAALTVTIGNLTMTGSVYRQSAFVGHVEALIVGGGGGWGKIAPAVGYDNPAGVLASSVVRDAGLAVSERTNVAADFVVGNVYSRPSAPAGDTLEDISGGLWWVDTSGVTQVGARPPATITSAFTVEDFDAASGVALIASEDPRSWMPGASFQGPTLSGTVSFIRHTFDNEGVARMHVMLV